MFESEILHFGVDLKHHNALILSIFGGNYQLLFVMNIFTSFLIPMLTIAVVDDTCFYNVFFQADPVSVSFFADTTFQMKAGATFNFAATAGYIKYYIQINHYRSIYIWLHMFGSYNESIHSAIHANVYSVYFKEHYSNDMPLLGSARNRKGSRGHGSWKTAYVYEIA